jgi:hypothetical protein
LDPLFRPPLLTFKAVKIPDKLGGDAAAAGHRELLSQGLFLPDLGQLTRIQPVPAAIRTLIHLHPALGAEEVPMQLDSGASRAFPLLRWVHDYPRVRSKMQQGVPGLVLFINLLEFEGIKPNSGTAVLTDIDSKSADLDFGQFVETCRTFHVPPFPFGFCFPTLPQEEQTVKMQKEATKNSHFNMWDIQVRPPRELA